MAINFYYVQDKCLLYVVYLSTWATVQVYLNWLLILKIFKRKPKVSVMELPKCCGDRMKINVETAKFLEMQCKKCGDIVYLKKDDIAKPVMIDD